jgi:hypothetical protein
LTIFRKNVYIADIELTKKMKFGESDVVLQGRWCGRFFSLFKELIGGKSYRVSRYIQFYVYRCNRLRFSQAFRNPLLMHIPSLEGKKGKEMALKFVTNTPGKR